MVPPQEICDRLQEKAKLEEKLECHMKLTAAVFSRWVLQLFTDLILVEVDPLIATDRNYYVE